MITPKNFSFRVYCRAYCCTCPAPARAAFLIAVLLACLPASAQTKRAVLPPVQKRWNETGSSVVVPAGQKRFALVIGNTHYAGNNALKNPENDAKAMAATLKKLGFDSTLCLDRDMDNMVNDVHSFCDRVKAGGEHTVAFFYYSGHGVMVDGRNYLVPIGFQKPMNLRDLGRHAISAKDVTDELGEANAQTKVIVLDACRSNPFAGTGRGLGGGGLVSMSAQGMLIAFATAEGKTADDNEAETNGLYTGQLLHYLQTPGLSLASVFKKTQKAVSLKHGGSDRQVPVLEDQLPDSDEIYLLPGKTAVAATTEPAPEPAPETFATQNSDPDQYYEMDGMMLRAGVAPDALRAAWQNILQTKPNDAHAMWGMGTYYDYMRNDAATAESWYRRAASADPSDPRPHVGLGRVLARRDASGAVSEYTKALALKPDAVVALNNRAGAYHEMKQNDKGIADCTEAIRLNPRFFNAYFNRAGIYTDMKQYDKATADYTEVITLAPDDYRGYAARGGGYVTRKDWDRAISDYSEVIRLKPDFAAAYTLRGAAYGMKKQYSEAASDLGDAIRIAPDNADTYIIRGGMYFDARRYRDAIPDFTEAIRLKPDNAEAYKNRGHCYNSLGQAAAAVADYQHYLNLNPRAKDAFAIGMRIGMLQKKQ